MLNVCVMLKGPTLYTEMVWNGDIWSEIIYELNYSYQNISLYKETVKIFIFNATQFRQKELNLNNSYNSLTA